ncbi:hypothetical protein [Lentzea sp. NEAU-D7]|uniref:SLAC1 family transporter n=1 Tax=Lentzea sp. NEAU-D7 TaxID=2994667 RepID=UPI00224B1C37|nr:hypothetical protein [Lentzea sp. NEAU-D7]MCX2951152.1 hypothetical protein [Lentzea sp. NEAU-D7]
MRRAAPFGPNLFASVMGTGIVATAGASMPGLHTAATYVWALDAALLAFLVAAALRRWTWATVRAQLADPVMAQFWGAPPMALMTVGTGALLLGKDWIGLPAALAVDWTLWVAGTVLGLATSVLVPLRMIGSGERAFAGWLMPVVPPMVSAASGALLAQHLPEGSSRQAMVLGCYALFGVSLFATMVALAAAVTVRTARRGLPFALTWWSFVFPLGTLVTGTSALAVRVPSVLFSAVAVVLYGALVAAWTTVAVRTLLQR